MKRNVGISYQECIDLVKSFNKGQFGVFLVVESSCDNKLKRSGYGYYGRLKKVTMIENARLGCKYESFVNSKADEGSTFNVGSLRGMTWVDYPYIKQANRSLKYYLSFNYRLCDERTKFTSYYTLDGIVLSDKDIENIKSLFFKAESSYSAKQAAVGIVNEAEQTKVVQYCIDDICYIGSSKEKALEVFNMGR